MRRQSSSSSNSADANQKRELSNPQLPATSEVNDIALLKRQPDMEQMVSRPCMKQRHVPSSSSTPSSRIMHTRLSSLSAAHAAKSEANTTTAEEEGVVAMPRTDSSHKRELMHQAFWDRDSRHNKVALQHEQKQQKQQPLEIEKSRCEPPIEIAADTRLQESTQLRVMSNINTAPTNSAMGEDLTTTRVKAKLELGRTTTVGNEQPELLATRRRREQHEMIQLDLDKQQQAAIHSHDEPTKGKSGIQLGRTTTMGNDQPEPTTRTGKLDLDLLATELATELAREDNYKSSLTDFSAAVGPNNNPQASLVGAHRVRPTHAPSSSTLDGGRSAHSIVWGNGHSGDFSSPSPDFGSDAVNNSPSRANLAIANPVSEHSLDLNVATEVKQEDIEAGWNDESHQSNTTTQRRTLLCWGGLMLVVLVVVIILLLIFLLPNNTGTSTNSSTMQSLGATASPTTAPTSFVFNLLPDFTKETILNDKNQTTPQYKAYEWMQNDPWLYNLTKARLLQRFALVTIWYSCHGEEWVNATATGPIGSPNHQHRPAHGPTPNGGPMQEGGGFPQGGRPPNGGPPPHRPPPNGGPPRGPPPHGGPRPDGGGPPPHGGPPPLNGGGLQHGGPPQRPPPNGGPPGGGFPPPNGGPHPGGFGGGSPPLGPDWLSYETNECYWHAPNIGRRMVCNWSGLLDSLDIESGLRGTIPPEISLLGSSLTEIHIGRNDLSGSIPTEFFLLSHLRILTLGRNDLTGFIPSQIGLLHSTLGRIVLQDNQLVGSIPSEVSLLSNLRAIALSGNRLTGTLPYLPSGIEELELDGNNLQGQIPSSIGQLDIYNTLLLGGNQFSGSLPSELGNLAFVTDLFLMDNQLSGNLPSEISRMTNLQVMDLSGNRGLSGTIPTEWIDFMEHSLTDLDLKATAISGTVPEDLCNLTRIAFDCSETLCGCSCLCNV